MKFFLVSGLNDKGRKVQYKGVRERGKFEVRVFQLRIPRLGGPTIVYCVYTVSAGKYMAISDFIFV